MSERWPEEREQLPPEERHRPTDLNFRGLLLVGAGLILLVVLTIIGAELLTPRDADVASRRGPLDPRRVDEPPDPRITQSHRVQRQQLEASVDERLNTYGWVDPEEGIAHLPIDRAVELVLQRGLPSRMEPDRGRTTVPPAGADRDAERGPPQQSRQNGTQP